MAKKDLGWYATRNPHPKSKPRGKKFQDLVIKEIPAHGELSDDLKGATIGHLLGDCGDHLDHHHIVTSDVFGQVLFKAENGKWYTVNVEAIVDEVSKEHAKEILAEIGVTSEIFGRKAK